jgi:hypothetical protein
MCLPFLSLTFWLAPRGESFSLSFLVWLSLFRLFLLVFLYFLRQILPSIDTANDRSWFSVYLLVADFQQF